MVKYFVYVKSYVTLYLYQNTLYNDALTPLAALVFVAPGLPLGDMSAARQGTASSGVLLLSPQTLLM